MQFPKPTTFCLVVLAFTLATLSEPAHASSLHELELTHFSIVRETAISASETEVEFTCEIQNHAAGSWTGDALVDHNQEELTLIDSRLTFDPIGPNALQAALDTATIQISNSELPAFRTALLAGDVSFLMGFGEVELYNMPVIKLDEETDLAYADYYESGANRVLQFLSATPLLNSLQAGDVLLIGSDIGDYQSPQFLSPELLPLEVISVSTPGTYTELEGRPVNLLDVVQSGTFSAYQDNDVEIEWTPSLLFFYDGIYACEDESHLEDSEDPNNPNKECGFSALPFRFDRLEIEPGIYVSGEVFLRSTGINLEVAIRNGQLKRATVDMDLGWTATLELSVDQNVNYPANEKTIFDMQLPSYVVPIGGFPITFTPKVELYVGAEANLKAGSKIGIHQDAMIGMSIGWDDGRFSATPYGHTEPLTATAPQLADDSHASAKAWVGAEFKVDIEHSAGPFFRTEAFGELEVSPTNDPWWDIQFGTETYPGFELSLFGFDIAQWTPNNPEVQLAGRQNQLRDPHATEAPSSGRDVRWGIAIENQSTDIRSEHVKVAKLSDGSAVITSRTATDGYLTRVDKSGQVIWNQNLDTAYPTRSYELPNGNIIACGEKGSAWWIGEFDNSDGSRLWVQSHDLGAQVSLDDFTPFIDENNNQAFLLIGVKTIGTVHEKDPIFLRLDAQGDVTWVKQYESPGTDQFQAVTALEDGGFALAGRTDWAIGSDNSGNGLVARMEKDGTITWATAIASYRVAEFFTVGQGLDGKIYLGGRVGRAISDPYPSLWVATVEPDGSQLRHTLLGDDVVFSTDVIPSLSPATNAAHDSYTAYDTAFGMTAVPGGMVFVGKWGLGNASSAHAFKMTPEHGISWFTQFEGVNEDLLTDVVNTGDGLVAVGYSGSFFPLGTGGTHSVMALKLPFEGGIDFKPQAAADRRYLQPLVYASAFHTHFSVETSPLILESVSSVLFTVTDQTSTPATGVQIPPAPIVETVTVNELTEFPEPSPDTTPEPQFIRSDCNGDGQVGGVSDAITVLQRNFLGEEVPCVAACDANADGDASGVGDAITILTYNFLGGVEIPQPFPHCGIGTVESDYDLGCETWEPACGPN